MKNPIAAAALAALTMAAGPVVADTPKMHTDCPVAAHRMVLAGGGRALPIIIAPQDAETLRLAAGAFAGDVQRLTGQRPRLIASVAGASDVIILGTLGKSPVIDALAASGKLPVEAIRGKWESAVTAVIDNPAPGVSRALVIAGSDARGAAYALLTLSREMGVSPWTWWADVPASHRDTVCFDAGVRIQGEPSVRYRGIFLNDEDWALRPWAAKKMDPQIGNIGPRTYASIFELMLRLRANTLWPAMHPGTAAFNATPENAQLADRWGIVMGSSHSEAMLRNNVGEWDDPTDGAWNYATNRSAIDHYWESRVTANGKFENFYTVGMRGLHDTGLESGGSVEDQAHLVEDVIASQRRMIADHVDPHVEKVPQVLWLYKEVLELYRAGMKVPDDVTLGWTDDNYGYIRQLSTADESRRAGGSAVYYHVSYWGFPHDYLWLATTPPAQIGEEMSKAWDHGARRLWILNVGDIKPGEADIDYFMQLAWDEPAIAPVGQRAFLEYWFAEQFTPALAPRLAAIMDEYFRLNFIRKPEFMGFNGYDDPAHRTDFNPLAWGDQNRARLDAWQHLSREVEALQPTIPASHRSAFYELVAYPVLAAAAMNDKFLWADRSFLDRAEHRYDAMLVDHNKVRDAYARIQSLTAAYNGLEGGKWDGMMDASPRAREVFNLPVTAVEAFKPDSLPPSWAGPTAPKAVAACTSGIDAFGEQDATVSINAAHFARKQDGATAAWRVLDDLGVSGSSLVYGFPGKTDVVANADSVTTAPWVSYRFDTVTAGEAMLTVSLLPVFAVDAAHRLRFAVQVDEQPAQVLDLSGAGEWKEGSAPAWEGNVLSNVAKLQAKLGTLPVGQHALRLIAMDPGPIFQHLTITFPGAPPAYPVPPETRCRS